MFQFKKGVFAYRWKNQNDFEQNVKRKSNNNLLNFGTKIETGTTISFNTDRILKISVHSIKIKKKTELMNDWFFFTKSEPFWIKREQVLLKRNIIDYHVKKIGRNCRCCNRRSFRTRGNFKSSFKKPFICLSESCAVLGVSPIYILWNFL